MRCDTIGVCKKRLKIELLGPEIELFVTEIEFFEPTYRKHDPD
jgi:hypothetical protein